MRGSLLVGFILLITPSAVEAQLTLDQAVAQLESSDPAEIRGAIESFGLLGSVQAVEPLAARIRRGLTPELLSVAVDTLTVLGHEEAGPVLFELLSHRRAEIRLLAVQGIASCTPRGADRALMTSLSDSSPEVRALAASTLGELGATSAVDALFLALDQHVPGAALAIARVVDAARAPRLLEYIGREPFALLRPALVALITRTTLPARPRLDAVARVGELATTEARALLDEVVNEGELPARDAVRRAASEAALRIAE